MHRQHTAQHHDPVDRVRAGHQRRVQGVRHLRDHLEAHERGQYEDGYVDHESVHRFCASCRYWVAAAFAPSCTISPPRVTQAPAMISSSKSSFSWPSSTISSSSDWMLRAYSWEACSAIVLGRLSGATILTP